MLNKKAATCFGDDDPNDYNDDVIPLVAAVPIASLEDAVRQSSWAAEVDPRVVVISDEVPLPHNNNGQERCTYATSPGVARDTNTDRDNPRNETAVPTNHGTSSTRPDFGVSHHCEDDFHHTTSVPGGRRTTMTNAVATKKELKKEWKAMKQEAKKEWKSLKQEMKQGRKKIKGVMKQEKKELKEEKKMLKREIKGAIREKKQEMKKEMKQLKNSMKMSCKRAE